jgi:hypothetical protein
MEKDIHAIIDMLHSDPAGISLKFGIPLRTIYGWCNGNRKPPEYVIMMMLNIILLERRLANYGNEKEGLEGRMGGSTEGIQEAGQKS